MLAIDTLLEGIAENCLKQIWELIANLNIAFQSNVLQLPKPTWRSASFTTGIEGI